MNKSNIQIHRVLFLDVGRCGSLFIHALICQHLQISSPPVIITASELKTASENLSANLSLEICKTYLRERNLVNLNSEVEALNLIEISHDNCPCSRMKSVEVYHLHLALERERDLIDIIESLKSEIRISVIFGFRAWNESVSSQIFAYSDSIKVHGYSDNFPRILRIVEASNNLRRSWLRSQRIEAIVPTFTVSLKNLYENPISVWSDLQSFLQVSNQVLPEKIQIRGFDYKGEFRGISNLLNNEILWDPNRPAKLSKIRLNLIERIISNSFNPKIFGNHTKFSSCLTIISRSYFSLFAFFSWIKPTLLYLLNLLPWRKKRHCECFGFPLIKWNYQNVYLSWILIRLRHQYYELRKYVNFLVKLWQ